MRFVLALLYVAGGAAVMAAFGASLHSLSVDVVSHDALVDALMKHGQVSAEDTYLGWAMPNYPPLSHYAAAGLGQLLGSGLLAMWLIAIIAIFCCYCAITNILMDDNSLTALLAFAALFLLLKHTHAMVGWEVIENFAYPHLLSNALFFLALAWLALRRPPPKVLATAICLLTPVIFLVHPLGGTHLTGAVLAILALEAVAQFVATLSVSWRHLGALAAVGCVAVAVLFIPQVKALLSYSAVDGTLDFGFPPRIFGFVFAAFGVTSAINLFLSLRAWPKEHLDRVLGVAGTAVACLMAFQWFMLHVFESGSFYAVKKHGFLVVTLGAINLARLAARVAPIRLPQLARQVFVPVIACVATAFVVRDAATSIAITPIEVARQAAQRLSSATSGTKAAAVSVQPIINMLISVTAFHGSIDELYFKLPNVAEDAAFVMVEGTRAPACTIAVEGIFSLVSRECAPNPTKSPTSRQ